MERNQVIGFVLISAMLIGYMFYQESITPPPTEKQLTTETVSTESKNVTPLQESVTEDSSVTPTLESKTFSVQTDLMRLTFSTYGADIVKAELTEHKDYLENTLTLIDEKNFDFSVNAGNASSAKTLFTTNIEESIKITGEDSTIVSFISKDLTITYVIKGNSHEIGYNITALNNTQSSYTIDWKSSMKRVEKGLSESENNSAVNYYTVNGEFDDIGTGGGTDDEIVQEPIKWVSVKQRFFNIGLIADNSFSKATITTAGNEGDTSYFKNTSTQLVVSAKGAINDNYKMYIGPNDYHHLKPVTDGYKKNIDLGWFVFSYVNQFLVIPIFKFLERYISNYGLIILCLVIIIKMLLFPIAYKSYLSMAKMKVLKPEIEAIKERVGDDMQAQQREQMKLYGQVGVNPISGCIPQFLQMPILFAMFRFFPNSMELRHQSFLWAPDLSTYDAPISWTPALFGTFDHISIFCLLMTITSLVYAYYNNQMNPGATGPMKNIGFIMPVIFFFVLNGFSAGLTFYYFVSTLITIIQQLVATRFIDKDKIRAKMEENKKNAGTKKKSGFRARMEEAMKTAQQQEAARKKGKK